MCNLRATYCFHGLFQRYILVRTVSWAVTVTYCCCMYNQEEVCYITEHSYTVKNEVVHTTLNGVINDSVG